MSQPIVKTVFLFGAGASNGCGEVYPHNPPLGGQLYDCLCKEFPDSWGLLSPDLKNLFASNFEEGMDCLWKMHSDKSSLLLQHMGIYFSRFTPVSKGGTLYRKLVSKLIDLRLEAKDVIFSTLNYDCLIDGELTQAGLVVNYLFSTEHTNGMPFIKLHGSCNWFLDFPMGRYVQFNSTLRLKAPIYSLDKQEAVKKYLIGDTSLYPVMRLYTKEKPAQLSPDFFEHLEKQWSEIIMSAEQVAIIGVKPYPVDRHIWDPLTNTSANIFYIGNKSSYEKWHKDSGRSAETIFVDKNFDTGFDLLLKRLFP